MLGSDSRHLLGWISFPSLLGLVLGLATVTTSCAEEPAVSMSGPGPIGKADQLDSCAGHCGEKLASCRCDASCTHFGDCCADYAAACKPLPPPGEQHWVRAIGGPGLEKVVDLALASDGRIAVIGGFSSGADLGDGKKRAAGGLSDGFIAVYSAGGIFQWARTLEGPAQELIRAITFTDDGGLAVAGSFSFAGSSTTEAVFQGAKYESKDSFVVRFSPAGELRWARRFGKKHHGYHGSTNNLKVLGETNGALLIAGAFSGWVTLGSDQDYTWPADTEGYFLIRLSADGSLLEDRIIEGGYADLQVARAGDSDLVLAGVPGYDSKLPGFACGLHEFSVARLAPDFTVRWARQFGGTGAVEVTDLAVGPNGDIAVTGGYRGPKSSPCDRGYLQLGSRKLQERCADQGFVVLLAGADGQPRDAHSFGDGEAADRATAVTFDAGGNVVVTGVLAGTGTFGPTKLIATHIPSWYYLGDAFLVQLAPTGQITSAKLLAGWLWGYDQALAAPASGGIVHGGTFNETAAPGYGLLGSKGGTDGYLARWSL